jgi:ubiquinone/menaquinone biosynthesis C-methylase UbiE
MPKPGVRGIVIAALIAGGAVALVRGRARVAAGHAVPGGVLMGDAARYDRLSHLLLSHLFRGIAADIAASTPPGGRILEVGCGPGLLSARLAQTHGLEVTGLDLDPAMIELAGANALTSSGGAGRVPSFVIGDVAALPFDDGTFDTVVSTFSLHHWSDRTAGLNEIARVLAPGGRALIWDLKPGALPFHPAVDDAAERVSGSSLKVIAARDWRWPGPLSFSQRIECAADVPSAGTGSRSGPRRSSGRAGDPR